VAMVSHLILVVSNTSIAGGRNCLPFVSTWVHPGFVCWCLWIVHYW